jgi:hypothetical protein
MAELAFVLAERQNSFFAELVAALRDELDQLGVANSVHIGPFPELRDDRVYVLVPPHEWWSLQGHTTPPSPEQLRRTVGLCAEQPGTSFFEDNIALAPRLGGILDVNADSIAEFKRRGVRARHAPLGWTRSWSHTGSVPRDLDVLHLGIYSERRGAVLAANARELSRWSCRLVLGDHDRPSSSAKANYVVGDEKWRALASARVLLNIHVEDRPYFEWLRVVQAIANGAAIVSDRSVGIAPLVEGEHLLTGEPHELGALASELLSDEPRRVAMAQSALDLLRAELPFAASAQTLVDTAEHALKRSRRRRLRDAKLAQPLLAPPGSEVPQDPVDLPVSGKPYATIGARPRLMVISGDPDAAARLGTQDGVDLSVVSDVDRADCDLVLRLQDGWSFFDGALADLATALRSDRTAAFAHGITLLDGDPPRLANYYPWRSDRADDESLLQGGWLWRRSALDGAPHDLRSIHVPRFVSRFSP